MPTPCAGQFPDLGDQGAQFFQGVEIRPERFLDIELLTSPAGVPMELVRRVTGHKTVDVVLQNYFQPGRADFRRVLQANMPKLLSNGQTANEKSPKEQALEILEAMKAKTWKQDRETLLKLFAEV